jgi:hypothetical protein
MFITVFELTAMEMNGEGPSLTIDTFAAEFESKVPEAELGQTLMDPARGFLTLP